MQMTVIRPLFAAVLLTAVACSSEPEPELRVVDRETMELIILTGEAVIPVDVYDADFVVLGGGLGGIAAALSICSGGRTAILLEESDRTAGCFAAKDTTQYIENNFVETSGSSRTYHQFRKVIRTWYTERAAKPPSLYADLYSGLSDFSQDNFCFETDAALAAIDSILADSVKRGRLTILKRHKVAGIMSYQDRISSVQTIDLETHECDHVRGWMYVDATRTGDFLTIAGIASAITDSTAALTTLYGLDPASNPDVMKRDGVYVSPLSTLNPSRPDPRYTVTIPLGRTRHIRPLTMVTEQDIAAESNTGPRAPFRSDSVGIGYAPMNEPDGVDMKPIETLPFQIPLGALISEGLTNVIAGGRTIGATMTAATAYQAPSVEWAVGEAAGKIAVYCAGKHILTHDLAASKQDILQLQKWMVSKGGVPIFWYNDVTPSDPDFEEAQLAPFTGAVDPGTVPISYRQ